MTNRLVLLTLGAVSLFLLTRAAHRPEAPAKPRHVILMIGDGMGPSQVSFARNLELEAGERFSFESLPTTALVSTRSNSNPVTDSAAAATALASGSKTNNRHVGVDPHGVALPTLTDLAQRQGWRIGYVTNTAITHATPAAFYAEVENRYTQTDQIALDLLEQGPDVVLGGGWRDFVGPVGFGRRLDGRNLLQEAEDQGYAVWRFRDDLDLAYRGRVLGLFAGNHLPMQLDRDQLPPAVRPPSLTELTRTALSLLKGSEDPFFLMVEGGRIDHAGHDFDAKGVAAELVDFDGVVREVLAFVDEHPDTLVLLTADHATGGLATNDFAHWDEFDDQKASVEWVTLGIRDTEDPVDTAYVREMLGYSGFSDELVERVRREASSYEAKRILGRELGLHQGISWIHDVDPFNTGGHTGEDVALYAIGPGAERFQGVLDNTEIPTLLVDLLGWPPLPGPARGLGAGTYAN